MVRVLHGPAPARQRSALSAGHRQGGPAPPTKLAHHSRLQPATPEPTPSAGCRGTPGRPLPRRGAGPPRVRQTGERGSCGSEGGVTSGRGGSPRSGTFWGGGGSGEGNGRGREEAPTPRAPPRAGPPPARDPWPPPYAGACVGTCAGAPRRGRPPRSAPGGGGCAGTDLASRFLVSAAGRRSRGERLRTRRPSGASSRSGLVAPPPPWLCARPALRFQSRVFRHRRGGEKPCDRHRTGL